MGYVKKWKDWDEVINNDFLDEWEEEAVFNENEGIEEVTPQEIEAEEVEAEEIPEAEGIEEEADYFY